MKPVQDGNPDLLPKAEEYATSIVSPQNESHPRIQCPPFNRSRYRSLRGQQKFFFALDLRQVVDLMPTLMGSLVEAVSFLGPENCAVSVVEGFSTDGTFEVLKLLQREMDDLGVSYFLQTSAIDSHRGDRIGKLAKLRNLALEPMMADASRWGHDDATIVFVNDVAVCADDVLELLYQKRLQGADMTCAMDYHMLDGHLVFYDVWVSRSMDGDSFFEVPAEGEWLNARNMFPGDGHSRARYEDRKPFQVFACWNGATAFSAAPFLDGQLEFRRAAKARGECGAGEPTLLCKDMWSLGYGKILVVPTVSLGYDVDEGRRVKESRGYTSDWTSVEDTSKVEWEPEPPEMVRCIPSWRKQFWRPWNHALEMANA